MKNVILKELTLSNWKAQSRHIVFGNNENRISGFNASGKSTLSKAWSWLLSGYSDAQTNPNSDLFNNKEELTPNTPKASVEAVISIDGEIYKIKRTAEAKFVRRRGTDSYEKASSDSYEIFIDDISRTASDFKEWLNEHLVAEEMLKYAIDGGFFINQIFEDKKKSRQLIEKLVGTVERSEMKGNYTDIDDLLQKFTPEEIEERAKNLIKGIDQRLTEIPSLINNKESEISEIEQTDFDAIEKEIISLEQKRADLDKQMTDLSERIRPQMEAKHAAEREKQMKQEVYDKAFADWKQAYDIKITNLSAEIYAIRRQNDNSKLVHDNALMKQGAAKTLRTQLQGLLDNAKRKRERLLKERDDEKARTFDVSSAKCPFCGTQLEGDKLQEQIDKFEQKKREAIDRIVSEGKATAEEIKRLEEQIAQQTAILEQPLPEIIRQSTEELEKKYLELSTMKLTKENFDTTEQAQTLLADIAAVVIPEVVMPDNSSIVAAKTEVNNKLTPLYERRGLKSRLQSLKSSIEVLRVEQKDKGAQMALYERQRQLVKNYKQEQMEILSHKVNDGLKSSSIECWSLQKDGTVVPDIVLKDENGVSYSTTNGASRIRVIADIQRLFCDKLNVNMPLWIDEVAILNQENIPHYDNVQTFLLFCADTPLNIESF